jgi:tetratricopeptide (TPR) repeat protein
MLPRSAVATTQPERGRLLASSSVSTSPPSLDATLVADGTRSGRDDAAELLAAGDVVGRYVVLETRGAGGMGVVYAAHDPELDRKVALKVLRERAAADTDRARFAREALALARLNHPNVVAIHDVGTHHGRLWIAMEYIEGDTMTTWRARSTRSWREVLEVVTAAARGLAAAHAVGLVHRDFKPDNVMIDAEPKASHGIGRVRVTDFGVARAVTDDWDIDAGTSIGSSASLATTRVGSLVGTPAYMAPEQFQGVGIDARTDQFALCLVLYEALYRHSAFAGATVGERAAAVLSGEVRAPPPSARVPRWLHDIVVRGLAVDPRRRFESIDALLDRLERAQRRARTRWIFAGIATLAAASVATVAIERSRAQELRERCAEAAREIEAVWPAAREDVERAMLATGAAYAASTFARASRGLDARAAAWSDLRNEACLTGANDPSDETPSRQIACLDERLHEQSSVVELLAETKMDTLPLSIDAVIRLAPIDDCRDPRKLAQVVLEREPDAVAVDRELRRKLARAATMLVLGRVDDAIEIASEVVAAADASDRRALLAEATQNYANALANRGRYEEAAAGHRRAFAVSLGAGRDIVAINAANALAFVVGYHLRRADEAAMWIDLSRELIHRAGFAESSLESARQHHAAILNATAGRLEEAIAQLHTALEMHERWSTDPLRHASLLNDLGAMYGLAKNPTRGLEFLERATEIREEVLGEVHPRLVGSLMNLGATYGRLERTEDALAVLGSASSIANVALPSDHPDLVHLSANYGTALAAVGRYEEARRQLQQGLELHRRVQSADDAVLARLHTYLGETELALGNGDAARISGEQAVALERALGPRGNSLGNAIAVHGAALFEVGRTAEALPLLEEALREHESAGDRELAIAKWAWARAVWDEPRERVRARARAEEARATFVGLGDPRANAVAAWLAANE